MQRTEYVRLLEWNLNLCRDVVTWPTFIMFAHTENGLMARSSSGFVDGLAFRIEKFKRAHYT